METIIISRITYALFCMFGVIGVIAFLSFVVYLVIWPFFKLSDIDCGQDEVLEDLEEIKKKLDIDVPPRRAE